VNAEYRSPSECGKSIVSRMSMLLPSPTPRVVVFHSPTPSTVSTAASSNGLA
jgi:ABC-type iron transport system FetAB ATPase subunit